VTDSQGRADAGRDGEGSTAISIPAWLSPSRIGAVYVLLIVIAVFYVWIPDTFGSIDTVKQVLNQNATYGLVALRSSCRWLPGCTTCPWRQRWA